MCRFARESANVDAVVEPLKLMLPPASVRAAHGTNDRPSPKKIGMCSDAELMDMLSGTMGRLCNATATVALLDAWYPELPLSLGCHQVLGYEKVCGAVRRLLDLPATYDEEVLGLIAYVVLRSGDALHVDIDRSKLAPILDVLSDVAFGIETDRVKVTLHVVDGTVRIVGDAAEGAFVLTDAAAVDPSRCLHRTVTADGQLRVVVSWRSGDTTCIFDPHIERTMPLRRYVECMEDTDCYEVVRYVLWRSSGGP